ncbi:hypothetical protein [Pseudomonas sp.]|uniref:hypothetical protein n=1 Tax=Pseudomonas sp. TaxID=306 RepID=UPI003FD810D2
MKSPEELLASFVHHCAISGYDIEMYGNIFYSLSTQTYWMYYRRGYYDGVDDARDYYFEKFKEGLK